MVEQRADYPCQADGVGHGEECPFPFAALVLDGHDGTHAGHVEQDEEQHRHGAHGCHVVAYQLTDAALTLSAFKILLQ